MQPTNSVPDAKGTQSEKERATKLSFIDASRCLKKKEEKLMNQIVTPKSQTKKGLERSERGM